MECNRDEALRARAISERKFAEKDVAGAKKFALKAQNLFPVLEGICQMIATLDVHLASEMKVNGEKDWYAILSVHALADEDTVKKQYKNLALQLHPDKNKSVGSEGAFQLISEAWSVLSDKSKRLLYDQKRNLKGLQQRTQKSTSGAAQASKDHSVPNAANGLYTFANNVTSKGRAQKSTTTAAPSTAPAPPSSNPSNTWTSCLRCKMQFEHLRVYLNHNLLCPQCREPLLATETPIPTHGPNSSLKQSANRQHLNSNHNSTVKNAFGPETIASAVPGMGSSGFQHGADFNSYNNPNFQWGPFSRTAGTASAAASSSAAAQAASMVHQTYEKVRREREEAQAAAKREEALWRKNNVSKRNFGVIHNEGLGSNVSVQERPSKVDRPVKKRRGLDDDSRTGRGGGEAEQMVTGTRNTSMDGLSGYKLFTSSATFPGMERTNWIFGDSCKSRVTARQINLSRELSQLDIKIMLAGKAKVRVRKKVEEWKSSAPDKSIEKEKAKKKQQQNENDKERVKDVSPRDATNQDMLDDSRSNSKKAPDKKSFLNDHSADSDNEVIEPVSIDVPDPDFHDFDKDRSERSFEGDQVWATYDEEDGMPRYYALVQKVISLKPFKIRMSFLTSKSNSELGPLSWVASGFSKTCGEFRVGRYEVNDTVNMFSHRVRWEKGPRGVIKIVPRKGDIWALYRNWSPDWNEHTPDDVIYKYDMVEVLEDYNEEQGVSVTPLVKVARFKTVFHRHQDPKEVKNISREEMFRFSHQVPSIVLTGEEAHNSPKGYYELDPAATPLELLQIITETKDDEVMGIADEQPVS